MKAGGRSEGEWKRVELQLDTAQILLAVAMLAGLCGASFYLGRWIERSRWQEASGRSEPPKNGPIAETDAGADLTFFDKLGKGTAEPGRQARSSSPSPSSGPTRTASVDSDTAEGVEDGGARPESVAAPAKAPEGSMQRSPSVPSSSPPGAATTSGQSSPHGEWAVQVFAGDRGQAERVALSLTQKGYTARVVAGSSGQKSARVRVVGYRSRTEAQQGADRLRKDSNLKPWVVKPD